MLNNFVLKLQEESSVVRKKREYRKRKHKQAVHHQQQSQTVTVPTNMYSDIDVLHTEGYSSEDEGLSPVSHIPAVLYNVVRHCVTWYP